MARGEQVIRQTLERWGLIEPRPEDEDEVRSKAMEINQEARSEIHESRDRRNVLSLEYELARRRHGPPHA